MPHWPLGEWESIVIGAIQPSITLLQDPMGSVLWSGNPQPRGTGTKSPHLFIPTNEPLGWLTSRGNSPVHLYVQAIERASNSKLYRPKSAVEVKNNILMTMDIQSFILVLLQHKLHNVYVFTGLGNFCCYYKQHKKIQNYKILIPPPSFRQFTRELYSRF